jgi:hypothetical protein
MFACQCTDEQYLQYPTFKIQIDSNVYMLSKENYIEQIAGNCVFKIMHLNFPPNNRFWVMGVTFFHNYYTVFDVDNQRIGFAESTLSSLTNSIQTVPSALSVLGEREMLVAELT